MEKQVNSVDLHVTFVAEIGLAHGDADYAHRLVESVGSISIPPGLDVSLAIKCQLLQTSTLVTRNARRYDYTPTLDSGTPNISRQATVLRSPPADFWAPVIHHARAVGVDFFPSVFDIDQLRAFPATVRTLKVASGDITHLELIRQVAETVDRQEGRIVLSTGASHPQEVLDAVDVIADVNPELRATLLACHLRYPSEEWEANLARITHLRRLVEDRKLPNVDVGYSSHVAGVDWVVPAVMLGASMIEVHYALEWEHYGDDSFAWTPKDLQEAVDRLWRLKRMLGAPLFQPTDRETPARLGARRVAVATHRIETGRKIGRHDYAWKRGFPFPKQAKAQKSADKYFWAPEGPDGLVAKRIILEDQPITEDMVEPPQKGA